MNFFEADAVPMPRAGITRGYMKLMEAHFSCSADLYGQLWAARAASRSQIEQNHCVMESMEVSTTRFSRVRQCWRVGKYLWVWGLAMQGLRIPQIKF